MTDNYNTICGLKSVAKRLKREQKIPYYQALNLAATYGGYENFKHASRSLVSGSSILNGIVVRQDWWGYDSKDGGTAEAFLQLRSPLLELVRPHHLTGRLGACRLRGSSVVERSGQQRHAEEAQWYIGMIARTLQFMDATGLKPSSALHQTYYPKGSDGRAPISDHDHCWFDPVSRLHLFTTNPYPSTVRDRVERQGKWDQEYGWQTIRVIWGSIYSDATEMFVCFPEAYASKMNEMMRRLDAGPRRIADGDVKIVKWQPRASNLN